MSDKIVSEQRLVNRMIADWERMRGDNPIPDAEKYKNSAVPDLRDSYFIVSITSMDKRNIYKYEYVGSEIKKAYGRELKGEVASSAVRNVPGSQILQKIDKCIETLMPLTEEGQFVNNNNKIVRYRSCVLPLGRSDSVVTHAVVGLSWKAF